MKIIFFGLGSIGQRHANILLENYQHELYAFRSGTGDTPNELGIKELNSWDKVKNLKPDVAFITNPTSLHIETAIKCAEINCKLFIEKPISKDLEGLEQLINLVKRKNLVTYIAYNLRFHPVIKKIKEYIDSNKPLHARIVCTSFYPLWRSGRDYLKVYSANSSLGGGVILDLSHELDYLAYLLGSVNKIVGSFSKRGKVTVDAEDFADMLVSTDSVPANIHINFLSQLRQRYIQVDFDNLTIVGDIISAKVIEYKDEKLVKTIKLDYENGEEYKEQMKYFFDNIDNNRMMNNLVEASGLFKQIITFKNG